MKSDPFAAQFSRSLALAVATCSLWGMLGQHLPTFAQTPPPPITASLPQSIHQKVLAVASQRSGIAVSRLRIAASRAVTWDGCLGVAKPNQPCQMIAIPGWQVVVVAPGQYWVYHTNQTAALVKLNSTTSGKGDVVPSFWQADASWLTGGSAGDVVFQSVTTGGFAGMHYKTMLLRDGRVLKVDLRGGTIAPPSLVRRLSRKQVQQFMQTLRQNEFEDFLGFDYPATRGADYWSIALLTSTGDRATRYADIGQNQTPIGLQRVIRAWEQITR